MIISGAVSEPAGHPGRSSNLPLRVTDSAIPLRGLLLASAEHQQRLILAEEHWYVCLICLCSNLLLQNIHLSTCRLLKLQKSADICTRFPSWGQVVPVLHQHSKGRGSCGWNTHCLDSVCFSSCSDFLLEQRKERSAVRWSQRTKNLVRESRGLGAEGVTSGKETENQGSWSPTEEDEACSRSWNPRALQQQSQGSVALGEHTTTPFWPDSLGKGTLEEIAFNL